MKNIFSWSAALGLGLSVGLSGCKDALNIEPQQSIDASAAYNTSQKVAAAVVGAYARLDDASLYGTDLILVPELLGSSSPRNTYLSWTGTFQNYGQLVSHTQTSTLTNAQNIWTAAYAAINQCNLVLDNLAVVTDAGQRAQYEGEVRFIRGLLYFELVRLYAQQYQAGGANTQPGVPLNLTPVTTAEQADVKPCHRSADIRADNQRPASCQPAATTPERSPRLEVLGGGYPGSGIPAAGQLCSGSGPGQRCNQQQRHGPGRLGGGGVQQPQQRRKPV
jgi:hypothetical protein